MLTGNPGKRPLNEDEPKPKATIPDCPPELSPLARKEWDRLAGELGALRMLTNLDRGALAAYCTAYALWAEANEALQKYGVMIKSPQGFPIQSPYLSIANRQAEIMMRIASEFGFTPASRAGSPRRHRPVHRFSITWSRRRMPDRGDSFAHEKTATKERAGSPHVKLIGVR